MKLLLAEDEADLAEALTVFLEKNNYSVTTVNDGLSAYDYASSGNFDGIILDIMMPKMNGLEVLSKLRSDGVKTPVMMLTAKGLKDDRIAGFDAGADDYLPKPFATDELIARLRAEFKKFDIAKAFCETAESFSDYAAASGRKLSCLSPDSLYYFGDEYSVRRLLSVLIENAVKYSPRDTTISISLEKTKHGVVIKESNACQKTEEAELDKLFDRFYRSDSARYEQKSGFGIGLAIAKNVAQNHNGDIKASLSNNGEIITLTVNLN